MEWVELEGNERVVLCNGTVVDDLVHDGQHIWVRVGKVLEGDDVASVGKLHN